MPSIWEFSLVLEILIPKTPPFILLTDILKSVFCFNFIRYECYRGRQLGQVCEKQTCPGYFSPLVHITVWALLCNGHSGRHESARLGNLGTAYKLR
jgi:hypothetical protein